MGKIKKYIKIPEIPNIRAVGPQEFFHLLDGKRVNNTVLYESGNFTGNRESIELGIYEYIVKPNKEKRFSLRTEDLTIMILTEVSMLSYPLNMLSSLVSHPEGFEQAERLRSFLIPKGLITLEDPDKWGGYKLSEKAKTAEYIARAVRVK